MAAKFSLGDAILNITGNVDGLNKALGNAERIVNQRTGNITRILDKSAAGLRKMGQTIATAFAVGATAAAGATIAVVKAASDFESAFAGVKKTVEGTPADFDALREGILKMTRELPKSGIELSKIMEIAGQMGITGKDNLLQFTKTIAMMGDTTNLTVDDAAKALGQFINITNGIPGDIDNIASAIVELGNKGTSTEKDITEMALRIAGAGTAAKMTQSDILGWAAAAANMGVESEMGGTAISKLILMMASAAEKGGPQLEKLAKIAGKTQSEFQSLVRTNPSAALESVFRGLNNINASGQSLFPVLEDLGIDEVRLRDTTLRLALGFDKTAGSLDDAGKAYVANSALAEEARKRYETFASQLTVLKNNFVELGIRVGTPIMMALNNFMKEQLIPTMVEMITWVDKNKEAIKQWVEGAVAAAVEKFKALKQWVIENKDALIAFAKDAVAFAAEWGPAIAGLGGLALVLAPVLSALSSMMSTIYFLQGLGFPAWLSGLFGTAGAAGTGAGAAGLLGVLAVIGIVGLAVGGLSAIFEGFSTPGFDNWINRMVKEKLPWLDRKLQNIFDRIMALQEADIKALREATGQQLVGPGSSAAGEAIAGGQPWYGPGYGPPSPGPGKAPPRYDPSPGKNRINAPLASPSMGGASVSNVTHRTINASINVTTSANDTPRAAAMRLKAALGYLDMQAGR